MQVAKEHGALKLDKGAASSSPDPASQVGLVAEEGQTSKAFPGGRALAAKTSSEEPLGAASS